MKTLDDIWTELERDNSQPDGAVYTRYLGQVCDLFVAVDKPANVPGIFLEVPSPAVTPGIRFPVTSGFGVVTVPLKQGPGGRVRIRLQLADNRFRDLFSVMCGDIVRHLDASKDARGCVAAFAARLQEWQRFFGKTGLEGLGEEAQRGLFTELLFLGGYAIPSLGVRKAVEAWTGPLGHNQDFQSGALAVEVKSSISNPSVQIRIANARQLDSTGLENLGLFVALIDARTGGRPDGQSLVAAVGVIRDKLAHDELAASLFEDRLLKVGYVDAHASRYEKTTYSVRAVHHFRITDDFPRIVEQGLPPGVGDVSYSIDLSACLPFSVSAQEMTDLLRDASGQ